MKRIVIVDDHPMIRGTIADVLRADPELDLVGECGDGEDGLKMVLAENPDLVILDHWLPVSSGGDLCRQIKDYQPTANIPVMLVSAVVNLPELASFCRADDYIAKPFELEEMTRKMKIYLD